MVSYDGVATATLADRLDVPAVIALDLVGSTMDVAHELARGGAADGTLVLAEEQAAGRGRERRHWRSDRGVGVWMTMVARAVDAGGLSVLPLRIGLRIAAALDPMAGERVGLKWPNDLYLGVRKLGGVLVEARWRDGALDWVAVGVGVNLHAPAGVAGASLPSTIGRLDVLSAIVPAVRSALHQRGELSGEELETFAARDIARGRECVEPVAGTVRGIAPDGALLVESDGAVKEVRSGSLVLRGVPQSLIADS